MALIAVFWLVPALLLLGGCKPSKTVVQAELRAAIVDQLFSLQPNSAFIDKTVKLLESSGFKVDTYSGDQITVDFYRSLPDYGYKFILFRAHAGLLGNQGKAIYRTCLFTNEPYSDKKYLPEQLKDQLAMARIDKDHPWVFAIGDKFINQSLKVKFNQTVVLMMGCSCLYIDDLARSFINKGASAYLGWDATVGLEYVDSTTQSLMNRLFTEKLSIEKAVADTMFQNGPDPTWKAELKFYPLTAGSRNVGDLIK